MKIGITMRIVHNTSYYEERNCISNDYIEFFEGYGFCPVLIANNLKDPIKYFEDMGCQALVLTGGDDILISYDEVMKDKIFFKNNRDKTEYILLDYCYKNGIPIFGICRGMQLISLYFKNEIVKVSGNHVNTKHYIKVDDLYLKKHKLSVNSYHNYGVINKDELNGIKCFAYDDNGVVEGIYLNRNILAVQWHPERSSNEIDSHLIECWRKWIGEKNNEINNISCRDGK